MSLTARLLNEAAARVAEEGVRKLKIDPWTAEKLAPVAVSLVLFGLKRSTGGFLGAGALAFLLARNREDLLERDHRLADPDVRARGEMLLPELFRNNLDRAVIAIADLAGLDPAQARRLLEMTAPAVVSTFAAARRALALNTLQVQGVVKSEAAAIDRTDPDLVRELREWVFQPHWIRRAMKSVLSTLPVRRARVAPAE